MEQQEVDIVEIPAAGVHEKEELPPAVDPFDGKSPEELDKIEADTIKYEPLNLVKYKYLMIKTKKEQMIRLVLNPVQEIILEIIKKLKREKKPIRLLILKARQMGVSTEVEGIIYSYVSQREGVNALVVADDIKGANYIFSMQKLFYEFIPRHLKPALRHSNEKKLSFLRTHSEVLIDTAENKNVGRKFTIQYAHLSEAAFFPDLDSVMGGLSQSVPNSPETMIVLESTANGVGNHFYTRWCEAVEGKSEWKAVFIPWFELPEYSMPLPKEGLYPIDNLKTDKAKFIKDEQHLKEKYQLTSEQLNWRRWCIINNCSGSLNLFKQEYPSSWQEAFIMSGNIFFDRDSLLIQEERMEVIKKKGFPKTGDIVKLDGKYIFRECEDGKFRLYEYPDPAALYCIGGDSCEGLAHGDDAALCVLNKKTNKTAMAYNCVSDTDELAVDAMKAGYFYNNAMIAVENKGYGTAVNKKIYSHYGNIFRKVRDKTGHLETTDELGWNTNATTRPQMLGQLREEIKDGSTDILDAETLSELRTFIINEKKKRPEAESGKKDDLVMARAIAGMVRLYYPVSKRETNKESKDMFISHIPPANMGLGFKKG